MLRHPARHYIYYLFSKRRLNLEEIVGRLNDLYLPMPQEEREFIRLLQHMAKIRHLMEFPPGFDPLADTMNQGTADFLAKWKIGDMWRGDPFVGAASDILSEPLIRRMVEALLLGPISPGSIADRVRNRFGLDERSMNVRVVRAFSHYFWDVNALSMPEWKNLVHSWISTRSNQDYLAAISAPRTPAGAALMLATIDRSAESLSPTQAYTAFKNHGFNMFMEHVLLESKPTMARTQGAFFAFQLVKMSDEELTKHQGGSAELLEEFRRIQTVYDASRITSVKDMPALAPPTVIDATVVEEATTEDKEIA